MKSKKITAFFILAAMLAGVVSCGSGNGDVVTTSGGEATDTTTAGETEIHDDLPELNYQRGRVHDSCRGLRRILRSGLLGRGI